MSAGEIRDLYENMRALIETGQAPVLRLLLRARFLEVALAEGPAVWSAYGFESASDLAAELAVEGADELPPRERGALALLLDRCAALPTPPHGDRERWERERERARRALAESTKVAERAGDGMGGRAPGVVVVPGVARLRGNDSAHPFFRDLMAGGLVPMTVRAEGIFRGNPAGGRMSAPARRGPGDDTLRRIPEEAARLRVRGASHAARTRFELEMNHTPASLDGRSCEFALVLGAAAAWSASSPRFRYRSVRRGVAMTGVVSEGKVRPVSGATLAAKVEACLHGPPRVLCVPASQEEHANAILRDLRAEFPGEDLEIRGVATVRQAWEDSALCEDRRRSILPWVAVLFRRLALSRFLTGVVLLIAILLVGHAAREWHLGRPFPVSARWEEDRVLVTNEHQRVILVIDEPGWFQPYNVENPTFDKIGSRLAVWDLDGDGTGEILVMFRGEGVLIRRISAYDRHGRLLWSRDSWSLGFPTETVDESLQWIAFYSSGIREGGSLQLVVPRRSKLGPLSIVDRIDGVTGEHRGMLANNGHVEGIFPLDADGDGSVEILISATHNETGMGLVAVIRPDSLGRGGPLLPARIPFLTDPDALRAGVLASIRFPLDAYSTTRAHAREVGREGRLVHVCVLGGWGWKTEPALGSEFRCALYYLDFSDLLRPVLRQVIFSDSYRALIRQNEPASSDRSIAAELDRLAREAEVLTPQGWRPIPRVGE